MSDLVTVVWGGPFEAHDVNGRLVTHGAQIDVSPKQAEENPSWYQPVPDETPVEKPKKPAIFSAPEPEAAV